MSEAPLSLNTPVLRSHVYKLLSAGFRYPAPPAYRNFQNGDFFAELRDSMSSLPHLKALMNEQAGLGRKIQDTLAGIKFGDFEEIFIRTFDAGIPAPLFPPYEGIYRREPRVAVMLEVSEFYKRFGLVMSGRRELPDHLCAELEFLHFLTFNEAQAGENGELCRGYILAQKDFLEHHVIRWVPEFCDKLQNSGTVPFYSGLARITSMFLRSDVELVISNLNTL